MAAEAELILKAVDETEEAANSAEGNIRKVQKATDEAATKSKGFGNTISSAFKDIKNNYLNIRTAVSDAFQAIQGAYDATIGKTLEYSDTVRQLSAVSGTGAEDTSRLIQMIDDLGIEASVLETAMRGAAVKGIALTAEKLAQMSDEYLKLEPGVERNTFLLDNFGRSGLEMAQVLNKGSATLRQMSAAVEDNLVLTDQQVQEARRLEIAQDNLSDSWAGLVTEMSNAVIPVLADVTQGLNDQTKAQQELVATQDVSKMSHQEQIKWVQEHTAMAKALATAVGVEETGALRNQLIPALQETTTETLNLKEAEQIAKEKADLVTLSMGDLTKEMIFNQLAAGLDAESMLTVARHMGMIDESTYTVLTDIYNQKTAWEQTNVPLTKQADLLGLLYDRWAYLLKAPKIVEFEIKVKGGVPEYSQQTGTGKTITSTRGDVYKSPDMKGPGRAEGGPVYAGIAYPVGEAGPEVFVPNANGQIVPNDKLMAGVNIEQINIYTENPQQAGQAVVDNLRLMEMLR